MSTGIRDLQWQGYQKPRDPDRFHRDVSARRRATGITWGHDHPEARPLTDDTGAQGSEDRLRAISEAAGHRNCAGRLLSRSFQCDENQYFALPSSENELRIQTKLGSRSPLATRRKSFSIMRSSRLSLRRKACYQPSLCLITFEVHSQFSWAPMSSLCVMQV